MPRIEIEKIPAQQIASYPREFAAVISGREKQRIGDAAGLTQFGVNVTRIKAGSPPRCATGTSKRTSSST